MPYNNETVVTAKIIRVTSAIVVVLVLFILLGIGSYTVYLVLQAIIEVLRWIGSSCIEIHLLFVQLPPLARLTLWIPVLYSVFKFFVFLSPSIRRDFSSLAGTGNV